jgi:tetratricopeptide (TPR) repeat protein
LVSDLKTPPNPRTDIYSLGVTFYQCLTGHKPYPAKTIAELKRMHASWVPKFPTELNPKLAAYWDGLLMGMLQKNPSHRFSTASAVLQQVLLLLGAKKDFLSVEDVEYRLAQHGLPIGKEEILERAKDIFRKDPSGPPAGERIWILEGEAGAGVTFLLDQFKSISQLKGVPVVPWNQFQQNFPNHAPFTWLVDDLEKMLNSNSREKMREWTLKARELFFKIAESGSWIVLGDLRSRRSLPKELQAWLKENSTVIRLKKWGTRETHLYLSDIFQTPEIPAFLSEKIFELGEGSAKGSRESLSRLLEKGLILDPRGLWRKDLYRATPLFLEEFRAEGALEEFERTLEKCTPLEQEILRSLCILHGPASGEFLEKYLEPAANPTDLYPALSRLAALGLLRAEGRESFEISNRAFKSFLLRRFSQEAAKPRHDSLLARNELHPLLSPAELHFQMARGTDPLRAAQGWAFFGDDCARKGLWESAFEFYSNAFDVAPGEAIEKKFEYSVARGKCLIQRNLLKEARHFFKSLLSEFAEQRHRRPEIFAKIFERLGVIETKSGQVAKAREYFYQALTCLDPSYEPLEQYLAVRNFLAGLELQLGNFQAAIEEFRDSYETAQAKLPYERRRILTNNDLGAALLKADQFNAALSHWREQALDLQNREDKIPLARCYYQMGQAYVGRNKLKAAEKYLLLAEEEARDLQNFELSLRIFNSLANLYRAVNEEKSLEMYEKALDAAFHTADAYSTVVVLFNMGFLLESRGQYPRSKHCLLQGLSYLQESGLPEEKSTLLQHPACLTLARCAAEMLQAGEALQFAERAKQLVDAHPTLAGERFETLAMLNLALTLGLKEKEAKALEKTLRREAKSAEKKKLLGEYQARAAALLPQLARTRARSASRPPSRSTRSAFSRTHTTQILPLHQGGSELDSSR